MVGGQDEPLTGRKVRRRAGPGSGHIPGLQVLDNQQHFPTAKRETGAQILLNKDTLMDFTSPSRSRGGEGGEQMQGSHFMVTEQRRQQGRGHWQKA